MPLVHISAWKEPVDLSRCCSVLKAPALVLNSSLHHMCLSYPGTNTICLASTDFHIVENYFSRQISFPKLEDKAYIQRSRCFFTKEIFSFPFFFTQNRDLFCLIFCCILSACVGEEKIFFFLPS